MVGEPDTEEEQASDRSGADLDTRIKAPKSDEARASPIELTNHRAVPFTMTDVIAGLVAFAVIGVWLFIFIQIAVGALNDPAVLQNSEALIAILVIVGVPAGLIIGKVMDRFSAQSNN
jgi:F0F1-type ATP synthase assembly protein I